jgi:hypothetical protein
MRPLPNPVIPDLLSRRSVLRVGLAVSGTLGLGAAAGHPAVARPIGEPAPQADELTAVRICPVQLSTIYNGVYYYYAVDCATRYGYSMTSNVELQPPLDCVDGDIYCHSFRVKELARLTEPSETVRHQVFAEARRDGLKVGGKLKPDAKPLACQAGQGMLVVTKDYRIQVGQDRSLYVRTFLVECTPTGGTAEGPLPMVLMGVGQELAGKTDAMVDGANLFTLVEGDRCYFHLRRKTDLAHFHILTAPEEKPKD